MFSRWSLCSKLIAYGSMSWGNETSLPCNHFLSTISGKTGMEGRMIAFLPALTCQEINVHLVGQNKYLDELAGEGRREGKLCPNNFEDE